jgi:hypothetical protein
MERAYPARRRGRQGGSCAVARLVTRRVGRLAACGDVSLRALARRGGCLESAPLTMGRTTGIASRLSRLFCSGGSACDIRGRV